MVLVCDGLSSVSAGVLNSLDRDLAIERCCGEEVGVVGVPTSLESPVCDDREFAIGVTCLWVPAERAIVLSRRKKQIGIVATP